MTRPPDPILSNLLVRPMLAADLPSVMEVERSTPGAPHWSLQDYQDCLNAPSDGLNATGDSLQRRAWVAETDAGIVGFEVVCGLAIGPDPEFELESLVVRPQAQRLGVGSTLLATALSVLKSLGAATLLLEVRASNLAAIRLYAGSGFARTGLRKAYYGRCDGTPPEDAVLMRLRFEP